MCSFKCYSKCGLRWVPVGKLLLAHHQTEREIESKHLEIVYSTQTNFTSNEPRTNKKLNLYFCVLPSLFFSSSSFLFILQNISLSHIGNWKPTTKSNPSTQRFERHWHRVINDLLAQEERVHLGCQSTDGSCLDHCVEKDLQAMNHDQRCHILSGAKGDSMNTG